MIPGKFAYGGMPCLACGHPTVMNGFAHSGWQVQWLAYASGGYVMTEYVCTNCPEHWGFYGTRHPSSPPIKRVLQDIAS